MKATRARERGMRAVWVYLPKPESFDTAGPSEMELRAAQRAGFTILDLTGAYTGHKFSSLWIARWDHHPNAMGHRLLARKFYDVIEQARDRIPITIPDRQQASPILARCPPL